MQKKDLFYLTQPWLIVINWTVEELQVIQSILLNWSQLREASKRKNVTLMIKKETLHKVSKFYLKVILTS